MSAICDTHKKKVGVEQLYNPGEDRKSGSRRSDQLEIRSGRENQHPAEGVLRTPRLSSWRPDQLERRCWNEDHVPERLGPQAPGWAAQENGKETLLGL